MPTCVTAPTTRSPSTIRSSTACWNKVQVGLVLQPPADGRLVQDAVGLGPRRAHRRALAELRMRNWMPPSSVAMAIAPPSASTSLTRWPFADAADRRDCSSSVPASRCCASAATSCSPCVRKPGRLRCRHGRRRPRSHRILRGKAFGWAGVNRRTAGQPSIYGPGHLLACLCWNHSHETSRLRWQHPPKLLEPQLAKVVATMARSSAPRSRTLNWPTSTCPCTTPTWRQRAHRPMS